jgi:hypothetical protein
LIADCRLRISRLTLHVSRFTFHAFSPSAEPLHFSAAT